jgi:hypothetical protein
MNNSLKVCLFDIYLQRVEYDPYRFVVVQLVIRVLMFAFYIVKPCHKKKIRFSLFYFCQILFVEAFVRVVLVFADLLDN